LGVVALQGAAFGFDMPLLIDAAAIPGLVAFGGLFVRSMVKAFRITDVNAYYDVGKPFLESLPHAPQNWRR
jgi:hypothetical protein